MSKSGDDLNTRALQALTDHFQDKGVILTFGHDSERGNYVEFPLGTGIIKGKEAVFRQRCNEIASEKLGEPIILFP